MLAQDDTGLLAGNQIANRAITHARYQNITSNRLLGRRTANAGIVEELTAAQARTLINIPRESGTWVPTLYNPPTGASITAITANFGRTGTVVVASFSATFTRGATASPNTIIITGFPYAASGIAFGIVAGFAGIDVGYWLTGNQLHLIRLTGASALNYNGIANNTSVTMRFNAVYRTS